MSKYQDRDYQILAIHALIAMILMGKRRLILLSPTGSGKTWMATMLILRAIAKGKRILFLAHRRELIEQTCAKLTEAGVLNFGVIMAGSRLNHAAAPVQVASIQTLIRRELPPADLIIVDECHRAAARQYQSVLANYPRAVVIGLTATPERTDGKGLDDLFDDMVVVETVPNLIDQGFLVKPVCYVGPTPDLSGIKTKRGDYDEAELAAAMDRPKLVGDLIANWKRLASGKPTAVFAVNVAHAEHIAAEFRAAGVSAAMVSGETPRAQREAIIADWRAGYITVVVNIYVFVEGFDFPGMECVILARPTQSVSLYLQAIGRVMRPAPGKSGALILDHAGCCQLHGPPHAEREWNLEGQAKKRQKTNEAQTLIACDACAMLYEAEPRLWLAETQPALRGAPALLDTAQKLLRAARGARAMNTCPGCGAATCIVCNTPFVPKVRAQDLAGVATEIVASCPSCHAHYADEPVLDAEPTDPDIPDTTDDDLVPMGDEIPLKLLVNNEYKRLINEAKAKGRKRGWAYWRLREKYDDAVLRECLPRHTGTWWRAQA
jgi:superfamily II DNA or RNA helicase